MTQFTFPRNILDQPVKLAQMSGGFFAGVFKAATEVVALSEAVALTSDLWQRRQEAISCVSRFDVPILQKTKYLPWTIRQSEKGGVPFIFSDPALADFDDAGLLFDSDLVGAASYPISDLEHVRFIGDSPIRPAVVWTYGIDFVFSDDRTRLMFHQDIFLRDDLNFEPVFEDGEIVDKQLTLWLIDCERERYFVRDYIGYVVGWSGSSTPAAKDALNAVLDSIYNGASLDNLLRLTEAATGQAFSRKNDTTVEAVLIEDVPVVVTDANVYRLPPSAEIIVEEGDVLVQGQPLSGAAILYHLNRGVVPDVEAIHCGRGFIAPGLREVAFPNRTVDIVVDTEDNKTRVSFELIGEDGAAEEFWDEVHRRGILAGQTLANLLDVRSNPDTEPTAASLPSTINPAKFVVANLLRNGLLLDIDAAQCDNRGGRELWFRFLRTVLPPETMLLMSIRLPTMTDSGTLSGQETFDTDLDAPLFSEE